MKSITQRPVIFVDWVTTQWVAICVHFQNVLFCAGRLRVTLFIVHIMAMPAEHFALTSNLRTSSYVLGNGWSFSFDVESESELFILFSMLVHCKTNTNKLLNFKYVIERIFWRELIRFLLGIRWPIVKRYFLHNETNYLIKWKKQRDEMW